MTSQHAASHCEGFSLGLIALVNGSPVTDIPPIWGLSRLHFPHYWPNVICQLQTHQGLSVPAISSGSSYYLLQWANCPLFNLRQWKHSSLYDRLERASDLMCLMPWRCSDVKLYSCRRWTHSAVCPSRFRKLSSQVKAEMSVRKSNLSIKIFVEMLQDLHNCQ